jgi:hypothetical protein
MAVSPKDYKYDIFISYRREPLTRAWINKHFIPLLRHHIFNELGKQPVFYIDEQLETGGIWPDELGRALGASRIIITLWSKTYVNSVWCMREVNHMLERIAKVSSQSGQKPKLVFPIIIHDGETMPIDLNSIQKAEIQECFNINMSPDSPKAEMLADKLKPIGMSIANAIENAPAFEQDWQVDAADAFYRLYYKQVQAQQTEIPKFTDQ